MRISAKSSAAVGDRRPTAPDGTTIGLIVLTAILTTAAVAARASFLSRPFAHDAGVFVYLGKLTADGGRFCHDVIDNKLPSVGMLTSVLWRMFGGWWPGYVFTQLMLGLAAPILLARIAARHIRPTGNPNGGSAIAVGLFALVYFNFDVLVFSGFQLETIESFFAILAAGAAMEALAGDSPADAFVVGLAAGCAAMAKPTGLAVLAAFAVARVAKAFTSTNGDRSGGNATSRRAFVRLTIHVIAAVAGVAIPLGACVAYLQAADTLRDMPALFHQIARYGAETPWAVGELVKPVIFVVVVGFPFVIRGVIFRRSRLIDNDAEVAGDGNASTSVSRTLQLAKRSGDGASTNHSSDPASSSRSRDCLVFALAWFVVEAIGIVLQRRAYAYHFLVLIPPSALLFGLIPRRDRPSQLAGALLPAAALSMLMCWPGLTQISSTPARLALSDYLAAHTRPGDAVWQDEFPRLLIETDLRPGARMPLTFLYLNYDAAPLDYCRQFLDDLRDRKPVYVVLPTDVEAKIKTETSLDPPLVRSPLRAANYATAWRAMKQFVVENYSPETVIGNETVYRRIENVQSELTRSTPILSAPAQAATGNSATRPHEPTQTMSVDSGDDANPMAP